MRRRRRRCGRARYARSEHDRLERGATEFLDIGVKRNERDADHYPNHQPADFLRDVWVRVHSKLSGPYFHRATADSGSSNVTIASMTRWLNREYRSFPSPSRSTSEK